MIESALKSALFTVGFMAAIWITSVITPRLARAKTLLKVAVSLLPLAFGLIIARIYFSYTTGDKCNWFAIGLVAQIWLVFFLLYKDLSTRNP